MTELQANVVIARRTLARVTADPSATADEKREAQAAYWHAIEKQEAADRWMDRQAAVFGQ